MNINIKSIKWDIRSCLRQAVPEWCSVLRWMANALPLERGSWEVCEKALVWLLPTPSIANGRGMLIVLLKLGEALAMSCPAEEHLGSEIHPWVPSILGSAKPLSLDISDSTENADVFAPCIVARVSLKVNEFKMSCWECGSVLKVPTYDHVNFAVKLFWWRLSMAGLK